MKKSTLVRSDKPHAVKMAEGTNVAQRKTPKKNSAPDAPVEAASNLQKLPPVEAAPANPIAVPAATAKPVRAKARTKARTKAPTTEPVRAKPPTRQAQATPKATNPKAPAKPRAPDKAQPETPTEPIWEQDNPIKRRIEELKTRNAQLAEQIQRVQNSPTARGKRP